MKLHCKKNQPILQYVSFSERFGRGPVTCRIKHANPSAEYTAKDCATIKLSDGIAGSNDGNIMYVIERMCRIIPKEPPILGGEVHRTNAAMTT